MAEHILENESLRLRIADAGAELCAVWDKELASERLWSADPAVWNRHAPILFPFVGRVVGGQYRIDGRAYPMKTQHGFARDMVFRCLEETAEAVCHELRATEETKAIYPYDFRLLVRHRLDGRQLHVEWELTNEGTERMYYAIGGHPGFLPPEGTKKEDFYIGFPGRTRLRYISAMHHKKYVVQPLAPNRLSAELTGRGEAKISWHPVYDEYEPTAKPTGFVVYTATGRSGFDNGTYIKGGTETSVTIPVDPEKLYSFRVTAVNDGGESFPSEVVSVFDVPEAQKSVLIVNGFTRLAAPQVVDNTASQGFDLDTDAGVTYGRTAGWLGYQIGWDKSKMGSERRDGLGYTNDSLQGQFIAGNDFDYIRTHAAAIATAHKYRVASCSVAALDNNEVHPQNYEMMDVILGLQRKDGYSLVPYQLMSPMLREHIRLFAKRGGSLLVSGAYLGSDMQDPVDRTYLADILKLTYQGQNADSLQRDSINGLGLQFTFHRQLNEQHYADQHPEIIEPVYPAFSAMKYADDYSASVAYNGTDYKSFAMGFPFECIKDEPKRNSIMRGILQFLLQSNNP